MGSAVGRRLVEHGFEVRTSLAGRSNATVGRALEAGMRDGDAAWLAVSDIMLSIVPPTQALPVARQFAEACRSVGGAPIYVDLNAINPATVREIEDAVSSAGCAFVDGCIIGTLPRSGYDGPFLYCSGPHAGKVSILSSCGLKIDILDGPNGAASALKMCFAAIMKGLTAIGSASVLAAVRVGAADALRQELSRSQPELMAWFDRQIPAMYPKTYRWVAEMAEIAAFLQEREGADIFTAISRFFELMSDGGDQSTATLRTLKSQFRG
jgi:3-hydroxyisobutyrate dehydrogenase-like beta-hydroxyacid dehydrogenase